MSSNLEDANNSGCLKDASSALECTWILSEPNNLFIPHRSYIKSSTYFDTWSFRLYPRGLQEQDRFYFSVGVTNETDFKVKISFMQIKMFNNDNSYELVNRGMEGGLYHPHETRFYSRVVERSTVLNGSNINTNCHGIVMQLVLHVGNIFKPVVKEYSNILEEFNISPEYNEANSDITFVVEGRNIPAHKCILAHCSPVFNSMFFHLLLGKSIVNIDHFKYETFVEFLRYVYTGKINDPTIHAMDLLLIAEEYAMTNLRNECVRILFENLNLLNVLDYVHVADVCNIIDLKHAAMLLIIENSREIISKTEFRDLAISNPDLLCEIIRALNK